MFKTIEDLGYGDCHVIQKLIEAEILKEKEIHGADCSEIKYLKALKSKFEFNYQP